jgi:hypothetical protein
MPVVDRSADGIWPMPTFEFREWLGGLNLGILLLAASYALVQLARTRRR